MKTIKNVFKEMYTLEKRIELASRLTAKHKDKIPIVVIADPSIKDLNRSYYKYIVSHDLSALYILHSIRNRNKLTVHPSKGFFLMTESGILLTGSMTYGDLYAKNKDEDGIMYLSMVVENTFGN